MSQWREISGSYRRPCRVETNSLYSIVYFAKRYTLAKNAKVISIRESLKAAMADADQDEINVQLGRLGMKWNPEIA
jgi:hypothetical protein